MAAERAGLRGVVDSRGTLDRASVPIGPALERLMDAVTFSRSDTETSVGPGWLEMLHPLIAPLEDADIVFDGANGSLSYRPFIQRRAGGLVLAVPSMAVSALTRYVAESLAELAPDAASLAYSQALWTDVERSLAFMHIRPMPQDGPGSVFGHRLYRIDEAQLLSVAVIADDPFRPEMPSEQPERTISDAHLTLLEHGPGHLGLVLMQSFGDQPSFFGLEKPPLGVEDLLLTPADLGVISRLNVGEPRAFAEFAHASGSIRDRVHVFAFNTLDEYAIYRGHEDSYYLSDDGRPTAISVAPGSGAELRTKAAQRDRVESVEHPLGGDPLTVMPRWDGPRRILAPVEEAGQPARIVMTQPVPIWVVGAPYATMRPGEAAVWHVAIDTVAYWLWELRDELEPLFAASPDRSRPLALILYGPELWANETEDKASSPVSYRVDREQKAVSMRLSTQFTELAQAPHNGVERVLVATLLEAFASLVGMDTENLDEVVSEVAPFGVKKMYLHIDLRVNADIGPDDVPRWRRVRDAAVAVVLDELGAALQEAGYSPQQSTDSGQRLVILHRAVEILFAQLQREANVFDTYTLLPYLLERNEAVLRHQAQDGFHLPARLACFPEDAVDRGDVPDLLEKLKTA